MTEHSLPDDLSAWPGNPFEVLGVERDATTKDAKRAYTRLIRVYRPEHQPEHFRRLREAYETVVRILELGITFDAPVVVRASPSQDGAASPAVAIETDRLAEIWRNAYTGDEITAYRDLQALLAEGTNASHVCVRLYWLRAVNPALDPDRHPCDWLVEAMRRGGPTGAALNLYRAEVESFPREAMSPRFAELLTLDLRATVAAELYHIRWRALRLLNETETIRTDLEPARRHFFGEDELMLLRLLATAAEAAAFEPRNGGLEAAVREELDRLSHLGTRHGEWFDSIDRTFIVGEQWRQAGRFNDVSTECGRLERVILDLIRDGFGEPPAAWRDDFEAAGDALGQNPGIWLAVLDASKDAQPAMISALGNMLQHAEATSRPLPRAAAEHVPVLVGDFIADGSLSPVDLRERLLDFCNEFAVDPIDVAQAIMDERVDWFSTLDPHLVVRYAADDSVRLTWLAFRVFWSMCETD